MKEIIKTFSLEKIFEYVKNLIGDLEEKGYHYHNLEHTILVTKRSIYLADKEGLNSKEKRILAISTLFHDTGFIKKYSENEPIGAKIARDYLEKNGFSEEMIKIVEENILATSINYNKPKNIFEKIIKDADLDNLGRVDENIFSEKLKNELEKIQGISISKEGWIKNSINFLKNYTYYTKTQIKERNNQRIINIKNYEEKLKQF